ncbi:DUF6933 domain-containing protein [Marinilactibacillus sp. GCM10026970]|uniref:DUF7309 domain-containing protein n=1 Tax=Marinilactibacillus sp. GCM10026970 TaxID=3252642 RepID=UPI00360DA89F
MRFHCSKKLLDLLEKSHSMNNTMPLPIHPVKESDDQDTLYDWHASVAELQGAHVATFTNDLTNFPVVVGVVDIYDIHDIFKQFKMVLFEVMDRQKIDRELIQEYIIKIDPPFLTKTVSRKKAGPLSSVTIDTTNRLYEGFWEEFNPVDFTIHLSNMIRVKQGKAFDPAEQWLSEWSEQSAQFSKSGESSSDSTVISHKDEWIAFYAVVAKIRKAAFWRKIADDEIIAIQNPDTKEVTYCSVTGGVGAFYGVGLYQGDAGLKSLLKLFGRNGALPRYKLRTVSNCLLLSFINRAEIDEHNFERLSQLGLFQNEYHMLPELMDQTPGLIPWHEVSIEEVKWMTTVLDQVVKVANKLRMGEPLPSLLDMEAICRSKQKVNWKSEILTLPDPFGEVDEKNDYPFKNDIVLYQLKHTSKSKLAIQVDAVSAPAVIQETAEQRPYHPMMVLCVDEADAKVVNAQSYADHEVDPKAILM